MNTQDDLYSQLAAQGYTLFGIDGSMLTNPGALQQYVDQNGIGAVQALGPVGDTGPSGTYGRQVAQLTGQNGDYSMASPEFRQIQERDPGWFNTTGMPLIGAGIAAGGIAGLYGGAAAPTMDAGITGLGSSAITDAPALGATGAVDASMAGGADMVAGGAGAAGGASSGLSGLFGGINPTSALAGGAVLSSLLNKPQTPASPDYTALANQQAQQNQQLLAQQTAANRYNQVTPYGNMTWTQDPSGNWTQTQTLSPAQQQLLDQNNALSLGLGSAQQSMLGQVNNAYSQPFTGGSDAARQQTIDSQYKAMTSRLDPQWQQRQAQMQTQLANQGISAGSEAYTNAMRDLNYAQNDAYQQAQNQALQLGNNEFQNSFNRNLTSYQLPMNMLNSLRTGSQVQAPSYSSQNTSASMGQPANLTQAAQNQYGANLNTTNANNAYTNNLTSGLFGLANASMYGNNPYGLRT